MTTNFYQNPSASNDPFIGNNYDVFPKDSSGFPNGCCALACNSWNALYRQSPLTSLNTALISGSGTLDFELVGGGSVNRLLYEITVQNTSGSTALNINVPLCINYFDIYGTSSGAVISEVYWESIYAQCLQLNYDMSTRVLPISSINMATWLGTSIPASTSQTFLVWLPSLVDTMKTRLSSLNQPFRMRMYFSPGNAGIDLPANCNVTSSYMWTAGECWLPEVDAYQNRMLKSSVNRWIFTQPIRGLVQPFTAAASTQYTYQMSSCVGLFSHLIFYLQVQNPTYAQSRTFQPLQNINLLSSNGSIVGQTVTSDILTSWQNSSFPGYILNQVNGLPNYYVMSFIVGDSSLSATQSCCQGLQQMDGRYSLQFNTTAGLSGGGYTLYVWAWQYSVAQIDKGNLTTFLSRG